MGLREQHGALEPLPRSAFARPATVVASELLGVLLVRDEGAEQTVVRLVETEAYREDDPASHAFGGPTPSRAAMFGPVGHAYVYFTYGMHWCLNVSCEADGVGAAVLLRAAVPISGRDRIRQRRGDRHAERDLLRGPARLTQGLAVDAELDGVDLLAVDAPLRLARDGWRTDASAVRRGPRVGVRRAADRPWRFSLRGVPEVSRYVPHPRADR